jgi:hypothetical protein
VSRIFVLLADSRLDPLRRPPPQQPKTPRLGVDAGHKELPNILNQTAAFV